MSELYVISVGERGPIKIGFSQDHKARLKGLQTACPFKLKVIGAYRLGHDLAREMERQLHSELQGYRLRGEWFDLTEDFICEYLPDFWLSEGIQFKGRPA